MTLINDPKGRFLINPRALAGGKETNQKQMGFNPKCVLWG